MSSAGWGGMETTFVELANELATRCRVSVLVEAGAACRGRLGPEIRQVVDLPGGSRRNLLTHRRLRRILRDVAPDVVHTHAARATEMVWWTTRRAPLPLVATKHNTRERRVFQRVAHPVAVSRAVAETIGDGRGVEIVYNGIRTRAVAPVERPEVFTMVAVGRLDAYKGFDRLVEAAATLSFPFRLLIAGEGPERTRLESLIRSRGLDDRIRLLGHRDDVPELLAGAHLQVVPSRSEGFSLALLEGVAYADLVLMTPVGLAPEILPDEFLVDPEQLSAALSRAHGDYPGMVARFAEVKARNQGRFTWGEAARRYLEIYERVVTGG